MKIKIAKSILVAVGLTVGMSAIAPSAARSQELVTERGSARDLAGVRARSSAEWNFAVGEGTEIAEQGFEIRQTNSFFSNIDTPLRPDEEFNRNNNIGDPLPEYGEVEILRF